MTHESQLRSGENRPPLVRIYARVAPEIASAIDLRRETLGISRSDMIGLTLIKVYGDDDQLSRLREVAP
jgi:hypothetical protein